MLADGIKYSKGPAPQPLWISTYQAAKAAGKIPDLAPSVLVNGVPTYAAGVDTSINGVCSWTSAGCYAAEDIFNAPTGTLGLAFDVSWSNIPP